MSRRSPAALYRRSPRAWKALVAAVLALAVAFGVELDEAQTQALLAAVPIVATFAGVGTTRRRRRKRRAAARAEAIPAE